MYWTVVDVLMTFPFECVLSIFGDNQSTLVFSFSTCRNIRRKVVFNRTGGFFLQMFSS